MKKVNKSCEGIQREEENQRELVAQKLEKN